jgi:hypothetical protein
MSQENVEIARAAIDAGRCGVELLGYRTIAQRHQGQLRSA